MPSKGMSSWLRMGDEIAVCELMGRNCWMVGVWYRKGVRDFESEALKAIRERARAYAALLHTGIAVVASRRGGKGRDEILSVEDGWRTKIAAGRRSLSCFPQPHGGSCRGACRHAAVTLGMDLKLLLRLYDMPR